MKKKFFFFILIGGLLFVLLFSVFKCIDLFNKIIK